MRRAFLPLLLVPLLLSAAFALGQQNTASDNPGLKITVSNQTCSLVLADDLTATPEAAAQAEATPEATAEPAYARLVLGDDCFAVTPYLYVASNDVLWVAVALPNEPTWQHFSADPADEHPPKLDRRGRFIGCTVPLPGEQTCRALWENFGTTYAIEIPIRVGQAYVAPPATNTPAAPAAPVSTTAPVLVSTPNNAGIWGDCGSCTTCGGPVEHCVLAPDNTCVWDARRCENPQHPDPEN